LGSFGLEMDGEYLVVLEPSGVLVHRADVVGSVHVGEILGSLVLLTGSGIWWRCGRDGGDDHDWERTEEDLGFRIIKSSVSLVPTGTLEE